MSTSRGRSPWLKLRAAHQRKQRALVSAASKAAEVVEFEKARHVALQAEATYWAANPPNAATTLRASTCHTLASHALDRAAAAEDRRTAAVRALEEHEADAPGWPVSPPLAAAGNADDAAPVAAEEEETRLAHFMGRIARALQMADAARRGRAVADVARREREARERGVARGSSSSKGRARLPPREKDADEVLSTWCPRGSSTSAPSSSKKGGPNPVLSNGVEMRTRPDGLCLFYILGLALLFIIGADEASDTALGADEPSDTALPRLYRARLYRAYRAALGDWAGEFKEAPAVPCAESAGRGGYFESASSAGLGLDLARFVIAAAKPKGAAPNIPPDVIAATVAVRAAWVAGIDDDLLGLHFNSLLLPDEDVGNRARKTKKIKRAARQLGNGGDREGNAAWSDDWSDDDEAVINPLLLPPAKYQGLLMQPAVEGSDESCSWVYGDDTALVALGNAMSIRILVWRKGASGKWETTVSGCTGGKKPEYFLCLIHRTDHFTAIVPKESNGGGAAGDLFWPKEQYKATCRALTKADQPKADQKELKWYSGNSDTKGVYTALEFDVA